MTMSVSNSHNFDVPFRRIHLWLNTHDSICLKKAQLFKMHLKSDFFIFPLSNIYEMKEYVFLITIVIHI